MNINDCTHTREPGCAIKAEMLRRKEEWHKGIAKFTRQRNKEIW